MTKLREFHITDLPDDRIFVLLEEKFHKEFFNFIRKHKFKEFNLKYFNNRLNVHTFKQWKNKKHFTPLWFVVKIHQKFSDIFPLYQIESNIKAYRGPSASTIIKNPALPLVEDSRLLKILAHTLGDGHISGAFGTNLPKGKSHSEYRNFSKELLDSFRKDLTAFGKVNSAIDYNHGHVIIPNLIGYILKHIYQINFDTFNSRLPTEIYSLNEKIVASFLRSFADDEAHVFDSSIEFYSANKDLLEDILTLIKLRFPQIRISTIKINNSVGKNPKYSFSILNQSLNYYNNLIGFDCPKKTKDLLFAIERRKRWHTFRKTQDTQSMILKSLQEEEKTAKELSRELFVRHSFILTLLNRLKEKNLVTIVGKQKTANLWKKTEPKDYRK